MADYEQKDMRIQGFEDVIARQQAQSGPWMCTGFSVGRGFSGSVSGFARVVLISNNIAEGFDRMRDAEFNRFLYFAPGPGCEVKSMPYLAKDLNYITAVDFEELSTDATEI